MVVCFIMSTYTCRQNMYTFAAAQSMRVKSSKVLPALDGSREGIKHLSDKEDVRYMCPEDRWNRAFIVKSKDTLLAALVSPRWSQNRLNRSAFRFFSSLWLAATILSIVSVFKRPEAPYFFFSINIFGSISPIYAILLSNRYLLMEIGKSFEFLWLLSLNGSCSIVLTYYAIHDRVLVGGIAWLFFTSLACTLLCDAWNPGLKGSQLWLYVHWYAVFYIAFFIIILRFYPERLAPDINFTDYFDFGDKTRFSFNPIMFVERSYLTLLLFFVKFLYSLYMYPGSYIILKARLYNKKEQVGDIRKKFQNVRANYRPSRLHTLR